MRLGVHLLLLFASECLLVASISYKAVYNGKGLPQPYKESILSINNITNTSSQNSGMKAVSSKSHKQYKMSVVTWNLAEKSPSKRDYSFLKELQTRNDFLVVGLQELEDIKPRRHEGHRSKKWRAVQKEILNKSFITVAQHKMGGMHISVYARKKHRTVIRGIQIMDVVCGIGKVLANKGAVGIVLKMRYGKILALVNAHLAAHEDKVKERNADFHRIIKTITAKTHTKWLKSEVAQQLVSVDSVANAAGSANGQRESKPSRSSSPAYTRAGGVKVSRVRTQTVGNGKSKEATDRATVRPSLRRGGSGDGNGDGVKTSKMKGSSMKGSSMKTSKMKGSSMKTKRRRENVGNDGPEPDENCFRETDLAPSVEEKEWFNPFDAIVFFGDLNYRLDLPRLEVEVFHRLWCNDRVGSTVQGGESTLPDAQAAAGRHEYNMLRSPSASSPSASSPSASSPSASSPSASSPSASSPSASSPSVSSAATAPSPPHTEGSSTFRQAIRAVLEYDQLTREKASGNAFDGFGEGSILFPPSFKYDKESNRFDTSAKGRRPAWTDRVLFATGATPSDGVGSDGSGGNDGNGGSGCSDGKDGHGDIGGVTSSCVSSTPMLQLTDYFSIDAKSSDHRPVCAEFIITL